MRKPHVCLVRQAELPSEIPQITSITFVRFDFQANKEDLSTNMPTGI